MAAEKAQVVVGGFVQAHVMLHADANVRTMFPLLRRKGCLDSQIWDSIRELRARGLNYDAVTGALQFVKVAG
jgi:hypothetical protein